ncbi:MAG: 30S ribosomal protein S12 methylthiotransferase RimO [Solobacterium sp.]|jgi:ribosomal protein S12 methylthiotransferase|nr:30S ribosomal protein S12 methylthiotransferase RimO [Solobacterium sp.]MCH4048151.1 30S ribosomal protein S12 methylthiotransferase RimO [Solobacterium sp.]MCH4074995.1 30S ribosomal protein S12 methylthiotransferase RimO [Solobacterium sp.]MCI1313593.1 30S ribosomal protein S12 methylthiotransferase RimO [Solobacterium sp.]MCI1345797.1 30S ribosomal protein S12 methylthiotransferase RimO [Solobacterium sp.]
MKVGIISLGCAKNLVDTENVLGMLKYAGVEMTTSYDEADAIIINTCGFIESAKTEAIETILDTADLKEKNLKKLIVMGCLVKRYKKQLEEEMPEVDRFVSLEEYPSLGTILSEELGLKIADNYGRVPRMLSGKPWMAYLQISDGCSNRCAFCAIPNIRGPLHSRREEDILREAKDLIAHGVKEITLVAQDCSKYGFDKDHQFHLKQLLQKLDALEGIHWIRMLYLYPDEVQPGLIETIRQSKHILPYFDIPTQSGSDHVLHAMRRATSRQKILDLTSLIRRELPDAVLRTTLITGFPGETEADYEETLSMIEQVQWDHLGAFTYSREEDTPAFDMVDDVPAEEKERRQKNLLAMQEKIALSLLEKRVGRTMEVLVESVDPLTDMYIGRTGEMAPDHVDGEVRFHTEKNYIPGQFTRVKITKISGENLIGIDQQEE